MANKQQPQIDAIRDGLKRMAQSAGKIWNHLNERCSRFDRHQGENFGLDPCQEAQLIAQAAQIVLNEAESIVQAAQATRDAAAQYLDAATMEVNTQCGL